MQQSFLSQTTLRPNQAHINFTQIDNQVIDLLTSPEAEAVCTKMFAIYARLKKLAWAEGGVLRLTGDGKLTAWQQLYKMAGVASATLKKALDWLKEKGVIGYWAGKNGVGLKVTFNLASSAVRQKNLRLVPTSNGGVPASTMSEAPFKDHGLRGQDTVNHAAGAAPAPAPEPSPGPAPPPPPPVQPLYVVPPPDNGRLERIERQIAGLKKWFVEAGGPLMGRVAASTAIRVAKSQPAPSNARVGASQPPPEIENPQAKFAVLDALPAERYHEIYSAARSQIAGLIDDRSPAEADAFVRAQMLAIFDTFYPGGTNENTI